MKTNILKKLLAFALSLSMLTSVSPVFAGGTPEIVDLCLDSSGSMRGGVEINAGYMLLTGSEKVTVSNAALDSILTGTDITSSQIGTYVGWVTDAVSGSYYMQIDLGNIRALSEIQFMPYNNPNSDSYFGTKFRIYASNDSKFMTGVKQLTTEEVTMPIGSFTTFTLDPNIIQYQYIKFIKNDDLVAAQKIIIKGYDAYYPQDLLHDTSGDLKTGITLSSNSDNFNGENGIFANINNMVDGSYSYTYDGTGKPVQSSATTFVAGFGTSSTCWAQVDLGEVKALDTVKVLPFVGIEADATANSYYRNMIKVLASNDPDFGSYNVLAETGSSDYGRDNWIQYQSSDLTKKYRYIRVEQILPSGSAVIGIAELQVKGYNLFEASVAYTNIDSAVLEYDSGGNEVGTKQYVSNVSNANKQIISSITPNYKIVNDRLQISFSGELDASTVTNSSLTITYTYEMHNGSATNTQTLSYTPVIVGNMVYIDICSIASAATVIITASNDIKAGGINITSKTIKFRTGTIAPVAYTAGKVINSVSLGKTVISDGTIVADNLLTDNGWQYIPQAWGMGLKNALLDLGNEYEIQAIGLSSQYSWNNAAYKIYGSCNKNISTSNGTLLLNPTGAEFYNFAREASKAVIPGKYRYIMFDCADANNLNEIAAYAYVPSTVQDGVSDAYFTHTSTGVTLTAETDGTISPILILARYDNEMFVDLVSTSNGLTLSTTEEGYSIKAFIWNGFSNIKPLTNSIAY